LNNATHPVVYWDPANPDISSEGGHATHVAGVIASTHNWRRGGAFNTGQVLSANFHSFGDVAAMVNSMEWAAAQGAKRDQHELGLLHRGRARLPQPLGGLRATAVEHQLRGLLRQPAQLRRVTVRGVAEPWLEHHLGRLLLRP